MQQTQVSPSQKDAAHRRTNTLAWVVLLTAFLAFCGLVSWFSTSAWNYYTTAADAQSGSLLIRRGSPEWITWQPRNRTRFQNLEGDQQELREGDQIRIVSSAGYGQLATIRLFERTTLDMWAGADVRLEQLQATRWNTNEQRIVLRQLHGYVRYDVWPEQRYKNLSYRVLAGEVEVELSPGGSYSVAIGQSDRVMHLLGTADEAATVTDIAVRTGSAVVRGGGRTVTLAAGQRLVADALGVLGLPQPARWELIRDGDFDQYTTVEYNNTTIADQPTLPRARTWQIYGVPPDVAPEQRGYFATARICQPPNASLVCDARELRGTALFNRRGGQTRPFTTGAEQNLGLDNQGIDISEYRSLTFSAWVFVANQSVPLAGDQGTECPVMIRFQGKRNAPTDPEEERLVCVYTSADPAAEPVRYPTVSYFRAEANAWFGLRVNLRDEQWLPDFRYLRRIQIYANGHDYDARITSVSLVGTQLRGEQ
ncbi:MAG: hypothetical protein MUD01_28540 [Chloroflexaceae bacterium]|nr:hypothetical protein [Chloroflexaceae bacterium]